MLPSHDRIPSQSVTSSHFSPDYDLVCRIQGLYEQHKAEDRRNKDNPKASTTQTSVKHGSSAGGVLVSTTGTTGEVNNFGHQNML